MITGPGDRNLLPALQALAGQPVVTLPNHGAAPLDLVDARDLAWALLRVALDDVGEGAYNVTGGCPRPLRQILETVAASIGASPQWRGLSLDEARLELTRAAAEGRPPAAPAELIHVASCERTCSIEKATRELGYRPRFTPP
jgi:nucleoside-diphosphate-sugar epimerase